MRSMIFVTVAAFVATGACSRKSESMDGMGKGATTVESAQSIGVVTAIDAGARTVTLSHDPIPEINWSAMTMAFSADPAIDLSSVNVGDNLHFQLKQSEDGTWHLALACRIEGDVNAHRAGMKSFMKEANDEPPGMMGLADGAILPCTE